MEHMSLQQALEALGNDPDTVASRLQQWDIRGRRSNPRLSPVSYYLLLRGIGNPTATMSNVMWDTDDGRHLQPTPDGVAEFLRRFDRKEYPHLVIGEPRGT